MDRRTSMIKDDFLILGFTGAFGSGCTTAASFFVRDFVDKKRNLVSEKDQTETEIVNFYKEMVRSAKKDDDVENRKKLLRLVRKRQIINALEDIGDGRFYYISMTDMLNSRLIKDVIHARNPSRPVPEEYDTLAEAVKKIGNHVGVTTEEVNTMREIEESDRVRSLDMDEAEKVFGYFHKVSQFRTAFHKEFDTNMSQFFGFMQEVGNNLRKTGNALSVDPIETDRYLSILSQEAGMLLRIRRDWHKRKYPDDTRTYFLIECFRNPIEIEYFRRRYNEFCLFAVYADEEERHKRAWRYYKLPAEDCQKIDERDQGGSFVKEPFAQNVSHCVQLADVVVTNEKQVTDLCRELLRYYALIKKPGCIKPTRTERNMNLAYAMSLNSTCICRQVGAVIVEQGYVIGAGWNDPERDRLGCMYRLRGDIERTDNESFPICSESDYEMFERILSTVEEEKDFSFCYKDEYGKLSQLKRLIKEKEEERQPGGNPNEETEEIEYERLIPNLTDEEKSLQHCRALHAEENAILQTSKMGGIGLKNATLYTTTFPCELCAKKILQVGIARVIYCEPYPKSVSKDVFFREGMSTIDIRPFAGVKSPSFFRLFKAPLDIKDQQRLRKIVKQQPPQP